MPSSRALHDPGSNPVSCINILPPATWDTLEGSGTFFLSMCLQLERQPRVKGPDFLPVTLAGICPSLYLLRYFAFLFCHLSSRFPSYLTNTSVQVTDYKHGSGQDGGQRQLLYLGGTSLGCGPPNCHSVLGTGLSRFLTTLLSVAHKSLRITEGPPTQTDLLSTRETNCLAQLLGLCLGGPEVY